MPKTINPIKLAKYKKARLQNKSIRESLLAAGLAKTTSEHKNDSRKGLVKVGEAEILRDITKEITVKSVLEGLCKIQALALADKDYSTSTRCEELKGKWLAMFTDKQEISTVEKEDNQFSINRLIKITASTN